MTPTPDTQPREEAVRMPNPSPEMLASPQFEAIWSVIKSWDVNVPEAYSGYCGANGSHVAMILNALSASPAAGGVDAGAWRDVLAERRRQVEAEGWTAAHDDEHGNGEMARAAASYALEHAAWTYTETPSARLMEAARSVWPWGKEWWKPCAGRQMLVKAAALILAEIERLDRKEGVR